MNLYENEPLEVGKLRFYSDRKVDGEGALKGETFIDDDIKASDETDEDDEGDGKDDEKFTQFGYILMASFLAIIAGSIFLSIKILPINVVLEILIGGVIGLLIFCVIIMLFFKLTGKDLNNFNMYFYKKTSTSESIPRDKTAIDEKNSEHTEEIQKNPALQEGTLIGNGRIVNYIKIDNTGTHYKQICTIKNDNPKPSNVHIPYVDDAYTADIMMEDMVNDIQTRLSRSSIWNKMLLISILGTIVLIVFRILPVTAFVLGIAGGIILLLGIISINDRKRRTAYLFYDIAHSKEQVIQNFYDAFFETLAGSSKLWISIGCEYLEEIKINNTNDSRVKTNICMPIINIDKSCVYFFPDCILFADTNEPSAISYRKLKISYSTVQAKETGNIPRDTKEIDFTWKHARKDGERDRRFKDNQRISIVEYGSITITDNSDFDLNIRVSNVKRGESFVKKFLAYQSKIV